MNNIYLIGYMGSGKSTVGRALAEHLGRDFIDLDTLITKRSGHEIPVIFANMGEDVFREIEASALHSTTRLVDKIIATGGGAPCFFDNLEVMKEHGLVVYLKGSSAVLVSRVKKDSNVRPILEDKSDEELLLFVESHLEQRSRWYEGADLVVDVDQSIEQVVDKINEKVSA